MSTTQPKVPWKFSVCLEGLGLTAQLGGIGSALGETHSEIDLPGSQRRLVMRWAALCGDRQPGPRPWAWAPIQNNITYRGGEPQPPRAPGRVVDHRRGPGNNGESRGGPGNDRKSRGDPKRLGEGLKGSGRTRRLQEESRETGENLKASSNLERLRAKGDGRQNRVDWRDLEIAVAPPLPPVVDLGDQRFSWTQLRFVCWDLKL